MIQPISQNFSTFNNMKISFKNDSNNKYVIQSKQVCIEDYLDTLVKEKQEQNRIIKQFAFGVGCLGTAIALPFIFKPFFSKSNNLRKKTSHSSEFVKSFLSLASDKKIPTLDNCNSLNDDLKTVLKQQVMQLNTTQDIVKKAGMPELTNRLILFGAPGSGKSFFAKIMAKSINAKYMEIQYSDFNSKWAGEGTQNLKNIFENIIEEANKSPDKKFVVAFNEIDTIIQPIEKIASASGGSYFMTKLEHRSTFLNYIDEIKTKAPNVIIIGTSNLSPKNRGLDAAAMSRFQNIVEVPLPNKKSLLEAVKSNLSDLKDYNKFVSANDKELQKLAEDMEVRKFSFRDLENLVVSSKKCYLEDLIKDKDKNFSIEHLKKAMDAKNLTDGDIIS